MKFALDLIDRGILTDYANNCRVSYQELSRKYGISANAIRRRVMKLEEIGVISGYAINLSLAMIDGDSLLGVIQTDGSQDEVEFVKSIGDSPNVIAASSYTEGVYYFVGEYVGSSDLLSLGSYVRSLESVQQAELHPLLSAKGGTTNLTRLDLRVLSSLREDPRMPIVDVAAETGLTARRVRRVIDKMQSSEAVYFGALLELGAASDIPFIAKIVFDEKQISVQELDDWMVDTYGLHLWQTFITVSEPSLFALFAVDELNSLNSIIRGIREQDFVDTVQVTVSTHHDYFAGMRIRHLNELISQVE